MSARADDTIRNHAAFIWSVADLLRGDYKQSEYGKVILPLTVLRRLDCVLEPTKQKVLDRHAQMRGKVDNLDPILCREAGQDFYNTSKHDFSTLLAAPDDLADNLRHYVASFSTGARDVLDKFDFETQIARLDRANLLYLVVSKFAEVDLHPDAVSNLEMGYLYEELIRRFSELSNETAGEHFTPREVIRSAAVGDAAATNVRPQIHHVDGHDICRVQVDPAGFPVEARVIYQKPNGPKETRIELFVRVANGTRALDEVEKQKYITTRWGSDTAR